MSIPIRPPFTLPTAIAKVRAAEDAWNTRDPERVSLAYTPDSAWRNRSEFVHGRAEIVAFLTRKWKTELEYRLVKELWAFGDEPGVPDSASRIAVRFAYEWRDASDQWFRSYGNENWLFNPEGLMAQRHASINDMAILERDRLFRWPLGPRPDAPRQYPGLSALGL